MREGTLTEDQINKIREEVLKGKSRWRVAINNDLDFYLVDAYTKDLPYPRRRGPCIYGKAFTLLQQLLSDGVVPSNQENHSIMRNLQRHLPMVRYSHYENKGVFYLDDKNKKALKSIIERSTSRIVSYRDLGEMLQMFNIEADSGEKKAFLGKKRSQRTWKIREPATRYSSNPKEKQSKIDDFLGIIWHSEVLRLYAIDVNQTANDTVNLHVAWNYTYYGTSQASPTLINDTLYFDGYNNSLNVSHRDPHIYAVYTNGTLKWKRNYSGITWFTFTRDPRGGFWYEDCDPVFRTQTGGDKLVRFREDNGSIMEEINITNLLNIPGNTENFIPCSDMTICGSPTNPIMFISANHPHHDPGKYVLAIELISKNNNRIILKTPINSPDNRNYAGGDYTILNEGGEYRVLFPTNVGGVMAIGRNPNCSFNSISSKIWDSTGKWNDSMNATYTIKTSVKQDRSHITALLISKDHPNLCRYKTEKNTTVTTSGTTDNITDTLPPYAPAGLYNLTVYLYNSSGYFYRKDLFLPGPLDHGQFTNATYTSGEINLHPSNDPPATPTTPAGNTSIYNGSINIYTTSTTDPNGDSIWYQWRWDTGLGYDYYTRWITGGPHSSGQTCSRTISWPFAGTYQVRVRAKDNPYSLNATAWSLPLTVTVTHHGNGAAPWNNDLLSEFTATMLTVNQQTSCAGLATKTSSNPLTTGLYNWTWHFGDGAVSYNQSIQHNYSHLGTYKVNLTIRNSAGDTYNTTKNISVVVLHSNFNITGNAQPGQTAYFHDLSQGSYPIVNWTWNFHDGNYSYQQNTNHTFNATGIYNVTLTTRDNQNNVNINNRTVYVESVAPGIVDVESSPNPVPCGFPAIISANFFDNQSGVKAVHVNITNPNNQSYNYTMQANYSSPYDYNYTFNHTWQPGQYNYTIWVVDNANNTNMLPGFTFFVVPTPTIAFTTPPSTPANNTVLNHNWATVNVTIQDTRRHCRFHRLEPQP